MIGNSSTSIITSIEPFFVSGQNVKFQAFVAASTANPSPQLQPADIRATAGLGFVGKLLDVARFELNLCFPFLGSKPVSKPTLLFGIGTDFL